MILQRDIKIIYFQFQHVFSIDNVYSTVYLPIM